MSLRQIAKELGVSHTLLGLWRQGKRSLAPELEARYHQLVTSGYNATSGNNQIELRNSLNLMERKMGFEPTTLSLARRCSTAEPLPLDTPSSGSPTGAEGRNRTDDTWIFSPLLYP